MHPHVIELIQRINRLFVLSANGDLSLKEAQELLDLQKALRRIGKDTRKLVKDA